MDSKNNYGHFIEERTLLKHYHPFGQDPVHTESLLEKEKRLQEIKAKRMIHEKKTRFYEYNKYHGGRIGEDSYTRTGKKPQEITIEYKEELKNRYKYIYENACYILAPYVYRDSTIITTWLKQIFPNELLLDLESFLLSDIPFNESKFYTELEAKKNDSSYLNTVYDGIKMAEEYNSSDEIRPDGDGKRTYIKLDTYTLLSKVANFIYCQSGQFQFRNKKLRTLDQYIIMSRYENDGFLSKVGYLDYPYIGSLEDPIKSSDNAYSWRKKRDVGLNKSKFVDSISDYIYYLEDISLEKQIPNYELRFFDSYGIPETFIILSDDDIKELIVSLNNNSLQDQKVLKKTK